MHNLFVPLPSMFYSGWVTIQIQKQTKSHVNKKKEKYTRIKKFLVNFTSWSLTWLHDWTHVISRALFVYWSMEEKAVVLTKTENVSSLCVCGCCIKWSRAPVVPLLGDAVMFSMSGKMECWLMFSMSGKMEYWLMFSMSGKMEYWLGNSMAVNTITGVPGFTCTSFLNLEQPSASLLSTIR